MKNVEDIQNMQQVGQQNVDAAVQGLTEVNKGVQAIGVAMSEYAKRTMERNTEVAGRLAGARSVEQFMEIQSEHIRSAYEEYMAETSRIGNIYAEMAHDMFKPFERMLHNGAQG